MGKRIIIADDDYYFREVLTKTVTEFGHEVITAENATQAQQRIALEHFDALISDLNMPGLDGLGLMAWVKENKPMPVILMTGFLGLIETKEAAALGAAGFLTKPFKREDLEQLLTSCLRATETPEDKDLDDQFNKISIDDFTTGSDIRFDIYIRISCFKYVKIAFTGQDISRDRIAAYKSKGMNYLYMTREDFRNYIGFSTGLLRRVAASKSITPAKKANFLKHTSEIITRKVFTENVDSESYEHAQNIVENASAILADSPDALALLDTFSTHSDHVYIHSVAVSFYAALLAKALDWTSPQTLNKLCMGALFHDIGKKEIPRAILEKPRAERTAEDALLLETHTARGVEILSLVPEVPSDVVLIVQQHHENCLGTGYPGRLKKDRIHPMARLISVVDEFCKLALPGPEGPGIPAHDALMRIMVFNSDTLDREMLVTFMRLLKFEPPADFIPSAHHWRS